MVRAGVYAEEREISGYERPYLRGVRTSFFDNIERFAIISTTSSSSCFIEQ